MIKQCIICGADFEPKPHLQKKQVCCNNTECRKEKIRIANREYKKAHRKDLQRKNKEHKIKNDLYAHCKICGKMMQRHNNEKAVTHDECILNTCAEYLGKGEKLPPYWSHKLYNRGFTMADVIETLKPDSSNKQKNV